MIQAEELLTQADEYEAARANEEAVEAEWEEDAGLKEVLPKANEEILAADEELLVAEHPRPKTTDSKPADKRLGIEEEDLGPVANNCLRTAYEDLGKDDKCLGIKEDDLRPEEKRP